MASQRRCAASGPAWLALAASLVASAAVAAEPEGWYAGVASDATNVEVWRGFGWEQAGEQHGLSLRGGRRVNEHFAVELAARHAANLAWTEYFTTALPGIPGTYDSRSRVDASALQVVAVGILPFATVFEGYFTAGLVQYRISGEQSLEDSWNHSSSLSRHIHQDGTDRVLGAGIAINANQNWRVKVEYQYFGFDGDFLGVPANHDPTIDSFSIGVDYTFGRRTRSGTDAAASR